MTRRHSRREFLETTALAGSAVLLSGCHTLREAKPPRRKLQVAVIGCGGKGFSDTAGFAGEEIVALCDVDEKRAQATFKRHPDVPKYRDFRRMLQREKRIDTVVVATPDHTHAAAASLALRMGHHVYCQKPLTHGVHEARMLRMLARESPGMTAMGNQGTAMDGLRRGVELVRAGVIGPVREVHCWTDRPIWPQPVHKPLKGMPVPPHLAWDLWLGPAAYRPYHDGYLPFKWRAWWDFGTGALGDMACHVANLAFLALELGYPTQIEAESTPVSEESAPRSSVVRYEFPPRPGYPATKLTWYDGGKMPPAEITRGLKLAKNGSLLIGEAGMLYCDDPYGRRPRLLPAEKFKDFSGPEPSLPRVKSIYAEFIDACKGGAAAMSNFEYAGMLSEAVLLGDVALRSQQRIEWDGPNMHIPNAPEAERYLRRSYREGWSL